MFKQIVVSVLIFTLSAFGMSWKKPCPFADNWSREEKSYSDALEAAKANPSSEKIAKIAKEALKDYGIDENCIVLGKLDVDGLGGLVTPNPEETKFVVRIDENFNDIQLEFHIYHELGHVFDYLQKKFDWDKRLDMENQANIHACKKLLEKQKLGPIIAMLAMMGHGIIYNSKRANLEYHEWDKEYRELCNFMEQNGFVIDAYAYNNIFRLEVYKDKMLCCCALLESKNGKLVLNGYDKQQPLPVGIIPVSFANKSSDGNANAKHIQSELQNILPISHIQTTILGYLSGN